MELSIEKITQLENNGYTVFKVTDADEIQKWNTNIWLRNSQGLDTPFYNEMYDIPVLPHGTEISLDISAYPTGLAQVDNGAYLHKDPDLVAAFSRRGKEVEYRQLKALGKRGAPITWLTIGALICVAVIIGVALTLIYFIIDRFGIIHGKTSQVEAVDDITAVITKPNCQARTWDSLNHKWVDGDDWSAPGSTPGDDMSKMFQYLLYGMLAIGGLVVVMSLMKSSSSEKYYIQHPSERPPPRQGYLSRKWYGD